MADYMQARVMEGQPLDTEERDMFFSCIHRMFADGMHIGQLKKWLLIMNN